MSADRSTYYQEWYEANRAGIRASRRKRYASDSDYAERCKERSRAYRESVKKSGSKQDPVTKGPIVVEVAGEEIEAWTVKRLADGIGRSVQTVNHWQRYGMLPETPLRTAGGIRLYTDPMIDVVRRALKKRRVILREDIRFGGEIRRGWSEVGISRSRVING